MRLKSLIPNFKSEILDFKVKTFNFDGGRHLANQDQTICVRRANGFCTLCWVADTITDVQVTGDAPDMGVLDVGLLHCHSV